MNGKGIFTWPDGKTYSGSYLDDKKHGYGTFVWPSGKAFEGYWKDGVQDGLGIMK